MTELPTSLAGLSRFRQFVLYELVPHETKPNKTHKYPINPFTNLRSDAHDSSIWVTAENAVQLSQATGYGIGFVFTDDDPFFFIDIDDAFDGEKWTAESLWLVEQFKGAAVEVSQSGRGLHIIGSAKTTEDRRKKSAEMKFDLYCTKRFVALTGNSIVGDADFNCQGGIDFIVNEYLKTDAVATNLNWVDQPSTDWAGHEDDMALIMAACDSKSADSFFNGGVSFSDLWYANEDKLKEKYPDDQGDDTFDHSRADAALMQHLAFWTGRNPVRMDRLFRQSALMRDKYEKRGDNYVMPTISRAVSSCKAVHSTVKPDQPIEETLPSLAAPEVIHSVVEDTSDSFTAVRLAGDATLSVSQQIDWFKGCVYVIKDHVIFTNNGELLKPAQFNAIYGGYNFCLDYEGKKTTKSAFEAFTENKGCRFPFAHKTCFRPEKHAGAKVSEGGITMVNSYVPLNIKRKAGDISIFENVFKLQVPDADDRLKFWSYCAAVVQHKGVKFQWCPVLQGCEGNGKSMWSRLMTYCIGDKYCHNPNAKQLGGEGARFNSWMENKILICIEEIHMGVKRDIADALKESITNDRIEGQGKGSNQDMIDNRANFLMMSNHKDAVIKHKGDRRYMVIYTAQQTPADLVRDGFVSADGEATDLMSDLYNWLKNEDGYAMIFDALMSFQIPDQYNPATKCQRAPKTSSTDLAVYHSLGGIEHEVMEAIEQERVGFSGGMVSSIALQALLKEIRGERSIPNNKRREFMQSIGYDYHPALNNGRLHKRCKLDNAKSVIYVKLDHISAGIKDPNGVLDHYERANESHGINEIARHAFG